MTRLTELRKALGLSSLEMNTLLSLPSPSEGQPPYWCKIEYAQIKLSLERAYALHKLFGVSFAQIMGDEPLDTEALMRVGVEHKISILRTTL